MISDNRPLSPHLQVYRLPMLAWLSIMHRITGMVLSITVILLPVWLWLLADGESTYGIANCFISAWYGQLFLFAVSFSLIFHSLTGIRHLVWDTGLNMEVGAAEKTGYLVIALTLLLTVAFWYLVCTRVYGGAA